jgi:hypothetical protein
MEFLSSYGWAWFINGMGDSRCSSFCGSGGWNYRGSSCLFPLVETKEREGRKS